MATTMEQCIAAFKSTPCFSELKQICDEWDASASTSSSGNVELKDRILDICKKHSQSFEQVYHSKQVGAWERNRGGEGVQWRRAHGRVQVIKTSGFSLAAIANNAVAGEDNPYTREYAKYTAKKCDTHACFANYKEEEIRVGAWGATHALHGFACVHDGVESDIDDLTKDGKMHIDTVCSRDKHGLLRNAIEVGVKFTVVKWVVHAALPNVAHIVGGALNTVQQTSEGETWYQNLLSIVDAASSMGPQPDFKEVAKQVLKSQPPRAVDVPDMVECVKKWGGMPSGGLIKELTPLLNHFVPSDRVVSGSMFKALADLKFPIGAMPAHVINAVLFRHAASEDNVCDGFARNVTSKDLATLSKPEKRATVMKANGALMRAKEMLAESSMDPAAVEATKGDLMIEIVDFLLERNKDKGKGKGVGKDKGKQPTSLQTILEKFVSKVGEGAAAMQLPTDVAESPSASGGANFVQYTEGGETSGLGKTTALNKDITEGVHLQFRKPRAGVSAAMQDMWKIVDVSDGGVVSFKMVKPDGTIDDTTISKTLSEIEETYKTCKAKEFVGGYPGNDAANDKDVANHEFKGMVFGALNALLRKYGVQSALPMKRPCRAVLASKAFGVGCYVAVPASRSIAPQSEAIKTCPPKAIEVAIPVDGAPKMFIMPAPPTDEFTCQFWCMRVESDKSLCNCELKEFSVRGRRPVVGDRSVSPNIDIVILCATNFKKVAAYDELVLHMDAAETKKKDKISEPVLESKRARKSK
ncbi:unnamed protein product [Prorocentrum cordatum]|uniref:Uncharacterized protein n=1 Tax=Prorocentrum cordatum TaxID=2364126 RepID=A0ABN9WJB1_9DINO|nr:unnamed protein product [Polarella glacialis]